ncbi:LCP family protein [Patescibacteria group bacterium]
MDISPIGDNKSEKVKFYKKKWFKFVLPIFLILLISGCTVLFKTGYVLDKISTSGGLFESITKSLPFADSELKGQKEGRINIALLGMRGEGVEGGSLLADTIMVVSIKPEGNKASIISVPRDFYVTIPGTNSQQKINAVYHYGEQKGNGKGLEDMKKILSEISGQEIHYAMSINFKGFSDLVDSLGGVEIHLDEEFMEPVQFMGLEKRCDGVTFVIPSGNVEEKPPVRRKNGTYYANSRTYPLCFPENPTECGGVFKLPAGDVTLDGNKALCYVRSRATTSDFDRARRQQQVIQEIKNKALSIGTLTDFGKVNSMLDSLGNNVRTDMKAWEMKLFFEFYQNITDPELAQKVLENSEEGLLYVPENTSPEQGYILLPRGDNYDRIKELFTNII